MHSLKKALVDSYVGAILIALIASNGLTNLLQPIFTMIVQAVATERGARSSFGLESAILVFVHAFIYLLIAFLLLRWLYFSSEIQTADPTEEPTAD